MVYPNNTKNEKFQILHHLFWLRTSLNEKIFKFKIATSPLYSFCNLENETPIYLFYSFNQKKFIWSKLQELMNSKILLPQRTPLSAFFGVPDNKEIFEIINHLHLIFIYYLFKVRDTRKTSLEGKKKNIIKICNVEKQICFNDLKK